MLQSAKSLTFSLSKGLISLFFSPSPQPTGTCTHTQSPVSIKQFHCRPCRSEEPSTAQMTQSQATQLPLFLCLEQKNSLTSTLPWIVVYLWMLQRWSLLKGIHITESNRAFEGSWDLSQRGNVVECVLQQIAMKKVAPWNHFSKRRGYRRTADWGSAPSLA